MLLAGALAVTAVAVLFVAPSCLRLGRWQVRAPRLALVLWLVAFGSGAACAFGAFGAAFAASLGVVTMQTQLEGIAANLVVAIGLAALGGIIAAVTTTADPNRHRHRDTLAQLAESAASRQQRRGCTLVWLESEVPLACARPANRPEIVVSTGLRALVTPAQLQAVLAHEFAHLQHGHAWIVRLGELNARCLPAWVPAGRELCRATKLLIELIADDTAARQAGAANLANALAAMGRATGDPSLELRAERMTLRRWPPSWRRRVPAPIRL